MVAVEAMTDLALISVGIAVGLLIGVKLFAWAVIGFCRLFVSWIHKAL